MPSPPTRTKRFALRLVLCAGLAGCAPSPPVPEHAAPVAEDPFAGLLDWALRDAEQEWDVEPEVTKLKAPTYPEYERLAAIEGRVVLNVFITSEGGVRDAAIVSSEPSADFGVAALEAVLEWVYSPALLDGRPVGIVTQQVVDFTLEQGHAAPPKADDPQWQSPEIVQLVPPAYPEIARKAGVTGKVILHLTVDTDGSVTQVIPTRAWPPGIFEEAAVEAAQQWRFRPAVVRGEPKQVEVVRLVEFRLVETTPRRTPLP